MEINFLPFFLILLAGVLFSSAFKRFHLPWVLALIVAGIVVGPHGAGFVESNSTIEFMGSIGLIFLMFMAGLETQLSSFREFGKNIIIIALLNGMIPFGVGFGIGLLFGFSYIASLLLGAIFMSSSVAVILPALEEVGLIKKQIGRTIVASAVIVDIASLVVLSVVLQNINPVTTLPLPTFYLIVAIVLIAFGYALPKIRNIMCKKSRANDLFETEVRIIVLMLIGTVVTLGLLGLHPIIAGFFTGLVLSESIKSELLIEKLRTISYGVFIPVFFVIVGLHTNIGILFESAGVMGLAVVVIVGSIVSKYVSGWMGARLAGFTKSNAYLVGMSTVPQLSTTLAVVYTAVEIGILKEELIVSMVALSMISTMIAPFALRRVKVRILS
jgi:Kef-type K+ transport system membrane component KefB